MAENNKRFWERFAKLYRPFMKKHDGLYFVTSEKIASSLTSDMNVLEAACGSGQFSFLLAEHVRRYEATDFSSAMIDEAGKLPAPDQLRFSVADVTSLPFENERFDAVIIANALHIMPDPDKALKELNRVLKKDGILFAPTFLRGETFLSRLRIKIIGLAGFKTYSHWSVNELQEFIESHSFSVNECTVIDRSFLPLCYVKAVKI